MADNLDYWYDAQIRRYLTQFMRIFSGFKVSEGVRSGSTYYNNCLLYTSPSPRDVEESRMPSSA